MVLWTALSMRSARADQRLSQSPCCGCNREVQATLIGPGDICDRRTSFLVTAATTSRHFMVATEPVTVQHAECAWRDRMRMRARTSSRDEIGRALTENHRATIGPATTCPLSLLCGAP